MEITSNEPVLSAFAMPNDTANTIRPTASSQRDDGQQQIDQRALCLVLPHDHERCGRGRCRGDGAERDGLRDGQPAVCKQCDHDQRDIDQERRGQRL